jgi:hypothetical protein
MRGEEKVMHGKRFRQFVLAGLLLSVGGVGAAQAQKVTSEEPAGYLVFPKIVVDPSGLLSGVPRDTVIRITNTDSTQRIAHCFYVDGTPRCSAGNGLDTFGACRTNADCAPGGTCAVRECNVTNFDLVLTPGQPVGWRVSEGVTTTGVCDGAGPGAGLPCNVDNDCPGGATCRQFGSFDFGRVPLPGSGIFLGELKCVQVDEIRDSQGNPGTPVNRNDLIGNASIYSVNGNVVDVQSYNAIGVQALLDNGSTQDNTTMTLGGSSPEYAGCPAQVVVDHFFDGAPVAGATAVQSDLTLVPCSENLELAPMPAVTSVLQILVYNEFEQRFSTSTTVGCFRESRLSNLDRRPGQENTSIFNVNVQGTFAGQTVIRPVLSGDGNPGNGVLAVVEEYRQSQAGLRSAAFNVHWRGMKTQSDTVAY